MLIHHSSTNGMSRQADAYACTAKSPLVCLWHRLLALLYSPVQGVSLTLTFSITVQFWCVSDVRYYCQYSTGVRSVSDIYVQHYCTVLVQSMLRTANFYHHEKLNCIFVCTQKYWHRPDSQGANGAFRTYIPKAATLHSDGQDTPRYSTLLLLDWGNGSGRLSLACIEGGLHSR